jgi:hypothetical protein
MTRMTQSDSRTFRRQARSAVIAAGVVACLLALHAGGATAQTPPQPVQPPPPSENPAPVERPGFVSAFGTWWQQGVSSMGAGFDAMVGTISGRASQAAKGTSEATSSMTKGASDATATIARGATDATVTIAKGAADVARDTAATVAKLPSSGFAAGRERCILAPNGAPDCRVAAEAMCRARGYVSGTIVDFETAENCPPSYRVSSRNRPEGLCPMEHFVTRALCQ